MSSKTFGSGYQEKTDNEESNSHSQTKESTKEDTKFLGKKRKDTTKNIPKKENNSFCAVCKLGGNLLLCDNCVRSYHIECLKINEEDIPEGNWFCPLCTSKKDKGLDQAEMDEKQRKRLIKNEKRRLWRMKKKKEREAMNNNPNNFNGIDPKTTGMNKHDLIDSILTNNGNIANIMPVQPVNSKSYLGVINKMSQFPLDNSKICLNITYFQILDQDQKQSKTLSLPLLFPIPNDILKNFYEKSQNLFQILNKRKVTKYIIENYNQENLDYNFNEKEEEQNSNANEKENYQKFKELININENNVNSECDTSEEISKILKIPNSVKALNNIINDKKDIMQYNSILRDYWNLILEKKSSTSISNRHFIRYPINSKELYAFPDYHGLEEKYFNKTKGIIFPYFNGKIFNRLINIYDFILTFNSKIYINKFSIEELYSALFYSENYKKGEVFLLSSIHISLVFLLICELSEMTLLDLYNKKEVELIMLKIITEHIKYDIVKVFSFIYYSWPELIRLFLISNAFNKKCIIDNSLLEKIYSIHDVISYNTDLNFEEKILLLEKLIFICYETNFVRNTIKDDQEKKNEMKKRERELDEQLKEVDSRKKEMERQNQFTQPELRLEEINKKLKNLSQKNKIEYKKSKAKLEGERDKFKNLITEMSKINSERDEVVAKITTLKDEMAAIPCFNKSYLGIDGRGYKYYYFYWMENIIFIRVNLRNKNINQAKENTENNENTENTENKENQENKENNENKYEWRIINDKDTLNNDLIDKLSDKGIEELDLKIKLKNIYKKLTLNKNKNENNDKKISMEKIQDIFKNKTLKYDNSKNPLITEKLSKSIFITSSSSLYSLVSEQIKSIENNITKYLSQDNRQWESTLNREKVMSWLSNIKDVTQFVNILLFFNERIKCPYKTEPPSTYEPHLVKKTNKKILEDDENDDNFDLIDLNGNLDPNYTNNKLNYANRIRLWTKENESYNVEKIYLAYLRNVKTFPQLNICLAMFEIAVNELNKRKEYYRKKDKAEVINEDKEEEKKTEDKKKEEKKKEETNNNKNNNNENNSGDKRRTLKKKKLIDYNVECMFCEEFGDFLYCDQCPNVAHLTCAKLKTKPDIWICPNCQNRKK